MKVIVLMLVLFLSACQIFQTKVAPKIAEGVDKICDETSESVRTELTKLVNAATKPGNTISITCAKPPLPPAPPPE